MFEDVDLDAEAQRAAASAALQALLNEPKAVKLGRYGLLLEENKTDYLTLFDANVSAKKLVATANRIWAKKLATAPYLKKDGTPGVITLSHMYDWLATADSTRKSLPAGKGKKTAKLTKAEQKAQRAENDKKIAENRAKILADREAARLADSPASPPIVTAASVVVETAAPIVTPAEPEPVAAVAAPVAPTPVATHSRLNGVTPNRSKPLVPSYVPVV